jgi:hypothetical protein
MARKHDRGVDEQQSAPNAGKKHLKRVASRNYANAAVDRPAASKAMAI